jgi:translocation and assembly module TamB
VTGEDGSAAVRAGKYISENVYTDVTVGQDTGEVSLNLDLNPSLTVRGSVASDGNTGVGIFFERDY